MADERKNPEFLGGGPKFNTVGKDVRGEGETITPNRQAGYWLRVGLIGAVILALAATMFYLDTQAPGRAVVTPGRGGRAIAPDARPSTPSDPNLK